MTNSDDSDLASTDRPGAQPKWKSVVKTALGIGLLVALLVWNDNGAKLLETLAGFQPVYLAGLLLVAFGTNGISSAKWGLFLRDRGYDLPFRRLLELYLIGKFFSNFLPSMFGGDVARAYMAGKQIRSLSVSAASVFLERATGLVGLACLAGVAVLANPQPLRDPTISLTIGLVMIATLSGILAFYQPRFFSLVVRVADHIPIVSKIAHKLEQLLQDIAHFRHRYRLLLLSLLLSLGFNLVAAINIYVSGLAIGIGFDFMDVLVVTPVILVLGMIPVSPNNIGWWEWCFTVLLAKIGATPAEGLAVGLLIRAMTLLVSVVGGILLLREPASAASGRSR